MDSRDFVLSTDHPIDKVVWNIQGSVSVPSNTDDNFTPGISIPHGLPFAPLPVLVWSNSSSFNTAYSDEDEVYAESALTGAMPAIGQFYVIAADSSNVYITRYNWGVGSNTLHYRIFCLMPSSASSVVPYTDTLGDNYILNTDNNYMKLIRDGFFSFGGTTSYDHNLGYVPRVMYWMDTGGVIGWYITTQVINVDPSGSLGITSGLRVSDSRLEWVNPNSYERLHYRIYGDE